MKLYKATIDTQPEYQICWYKDEPRNLNVFCADADAGKKINIGNYCNWYRDFFSNAQAKDYMIDIGGNIGLAAFPVASIGHRVVSFEPVSKNIGLFNKGIEINNFNNVVRLEPLALSNTETTKKIYIPNKRADNASLDANCSTLNVGNVGKHAEEINTNTLDNWLSKNSNDYPIKDLKLIKIDTQGHELAVLQGAKNTLRESKEYKKLIIELEWDSHFLKAQGISGMEILETIDLAGFEIFHPKIITPNDFKQFSLSVVQCDLLCRIKA